MPAACEGAVQQYTNVENSFLKQNHASTFYFRYDLKVRNIMQRHTTLTFTVAKLGGNNWSCSPPKAQKLRGSGGGPPGKLFGPRPLFCWETPSCK